MLILYVYNNEYQFILIWECGNKMRNTIKILGCRNKKIYG